MCVCVCVCVCSSALDKENNDVYRFWLAPVGWHLAMCGTVAAQRTRLSDKTPAAAETSCAETGCQSETRYTRRRSYCQRLTERNTGEKKGAAQTRSREEKKKKKKQRKTLR